MSHDFARPRDQGVVWLYGYEPFKISHHFNKFHGHRYCNSGDIIVLACHVISHDHAIRESCDFIGSGPSRWATILPTLVVKDTLVVEI